MPKVKTHSGAKKRIKKLKSALFKAAHPYRRKHLTQKSGHKKRHLRKAFYISKADARHIAHLMPY